jgi:uncharacterized protein YaaN involved in tellurite resistance
MPDTPAPEDSGSVEPLQPPATTSEFVLSAPAAIAPVAPTSAESMVPLDPSVVPELNHMVDEFVANIVGLDAHSPEFAQKADSVRTMGDADIRAASAVSNRMLETPIRSMGKGGFAAGSTVGQALGDLRRQIEDLDPSNATGVRKILGVVPFGDKLRGYFNRYENAQSNMNAILNGLYRGQDELRKDNAALEQEKVHLWETMQRLVQYVYVAEKLDASMTAKVAEIDSTDHDRAKMLREDVLFYVRQKHQDLLTQLAVSVEGYLAIDLVRRNNTELIKGVDRATTTTIAALRTAVIVAQALANQKLVLDQITTLNTTTSKLIESTSKLLATQSVAINEQAASSTIGIDKLEAAFTNVYQTMDAIDAFKAQALQSMQATINTLTAEVQKAQQYLERVHDGASLNVGTGDAPQLKIPSEST